MFMQALHQITKIKWRTRLRGLSINNSPMKDRTMKPLKIRNRILSARDKSFLLIFDQDLTGWKDDGVDSDQQWSG